MKKLMMLLAAFYLTGCGSFDQIGAHMLGYKSKCVDGVSYLIFPQSVTVKYLPDGHVETCK